MSNIVPYGTRRPCTIINAGKLQHTNVGHPCTKMCAHIQSVCTRSGRTCNRLNYAFERSERSRGTCVYRDPCWALRARDRTCCWNRSARERAQSECECVYLCVPDDQCRQQAAVTLTTHTLSSIIVTYYQNADTTKQHAEEHPTHKHTHPAHWKDQISMMSVMCIQ